MAKPSMETPLPFGALVVRPAQTMTACTTMLLPARYRMIIWSPRG